MIRKPRPVCTTMIRASGRSNSDVFGPYVLSEWSDLMTVASAVVGLVCQTVRDDSVIVANKCPPLAILISTISCGFDWVVLAGETTPDSRDSASCCDELAEADRPSLNTAGLVLHDEMLCLEAAYVFGAPMGQYIF